MSRDNILHRVRTALGRSAGQAAAEPPPVRIRIPEVGVEARILSMMARVEALAGVACRTSDPCRFVAQAIAGKTAVASNAPYLAECGITSLPGVLIPLGVVAGLGAAMLMFGRYAQSAQYSVVEGQPGAAAAILQSMRGGWTVTPAVSANRNMDVVHRAVGKPGVVLVGEGSTTRLPSLLAAEKKRISRVAHETPIYDFQVGNEEGQVPIRKLQRKIMRLPRNLKGADVTELNYRLKALPQSLQAPKGPMPKSGRMPRPPRPRTR